MKIVIAILLTSSAAFADSSWQCHISRNNVESESNVQLNNENSIVTLLSDTTYSVTLSRQVGGGVTLAIQYSNTKEAIKSYAHEDDQAGRPIGGWDERDKSNKINVKCVKL